MIKVYEAIITPEENGYGVEFPDIPGCSSQGKTLEEAYIMGYDALGLMLQELFESGEGLPAASFGNKCPSDSIMAIFAVEMGALAFTERYVTVREASDMLSVSHVRIQALIKSGDLQSEKIGTSRLIDQRSVMDYRERRKGAGRPKREAI